MTFGLETQFKNGVDKEPTLQNEYRHIPSVMGKKIQKKVDVNNIK
jgi:hypothetical protein